MFADLVRQLRGWSQERIRDTPRHGKQEEFVVKKLFNRPVKAKVERPMPALRGTELGHCGQLRCCGKLRHCGT